MRSRERRLLERGEQVAKFCSSPGLYPPLEHAPDVFHTESGALRDVVSLVKGFDSELRSARGSAKRERVDCKAAQEDLRRNHLIPLHRLAKGIVRGTGEPGLPHMFRAPSSKANRRSMVTAAYAALRDAEPVAQVFVDHGHAPDFLGRLRTSAETLEMRMDNIRTGRGRRITAKQGISDALDRAQRILMILDVIVRRLCAADTVNGPRTLVTWEGISRAEPDPVRAAEEVPATSAGGGI